MTYVTADGKERGRLLTGLEFCFQSFEIDDGEVAAFDFKDCFRLKAGKIPRNQLANGANLRRQFLVVGGQDNLNAAGSALAGSLGQPNQVCGQAVPYSGERKFFDDADETPQSRPDDSQHLQRNLRMCQAKSLKILFADEKKRSFINRAHRCRIIATVEHRKLGHRTARAFDAENVLSSTRGTLEDPHMPRRHNVKSGAGLSFCEHGFSRRKIARDGALGEECEFIFGEFGENGDAGQCLAGINFRIRHADYCSEPEAPSCVGAAKSEHAQNRRGRTHG
jgi:hypothetical protein